MCDNVCPNCASGNNEVKAFGDIFQIHVGLYFAPTAFSIFQFLEKRVKGRRGITKYVLQLGESSVSRGDILNVTVIMPGFKGFFDGSLCSFTVCS